MMKKSFISLLIGGGLIGVPVITVAQSSNLQIEEIIVTSQKREESSQRIGLAISAIDNDALVKGDFNNISDLQNMAPSIQIGESFGFAQIMVRGIGTDNPFAGGDPSVAMHIDGVVTGQSSAQFGSLFDLERVEILRGPQGTLYGRNATGGAINIITQKPTPETTGYGRVTAGNYGLIKLEGAVGGSLTDELMGRIAIRSVDRDGYGTNIANGEGIDDADQQSIRAQLLWEPNESFSIRFAVEDHDEDDRNYIPKFRAASYGSAPLPALAPQPTSGVRATDPRDINSNVELQNKRDQSSYTAEVIWDINDTLSLTSITNSQDFKKVPQADFDMTANDFYIWSESFETEQFSEEIRLNYEGDEVHGLVGLFYYDEDISSDNRLDLDLVPQVAINGNPTLAGCGFGDNSSNNIINAAEQDLCFNFRGTSQTEAYALFGNVSFDLSPDLTMILGGRYSYENKKGDTNRWTAPGAPVLTFSDEKSFNEFSPSARLEWSTSDDTLVYASYSEGFKSGIFLSGQRAPVLEPELVDAYEIGLKGMFLDRQLQFNAAAFYYDYKDLQQGRSVPAGATGFTLIYENAASAEIKGAEVEFNWLVNEYLSFDGSATYLDSTFSDYISTDPFDTVYQQLGLIASSVDLSQQLGGNKMVQAPELAWTLGATLDLPLSDTGWYTSSSISASFKDDIFFTQFNHAALGQESVTTVDANIHITSPDENWTVNFWGKNLTDETVYMGTFILNSSRTNAGFLAPPRTVGVTVGYDF